MFNYMSESKSTYGEASVKPLHGWSKTHRSNYKSNCKFKYKSNYG